MIGQYSSPENPSTLPFAPLWTARREPITQQQRGKDTR